MAGSTCNMWIQRQAECARPALNVQPLRMSQFAPPTPPTLTLLYHRTMMRLSLLSAQALCGPPLGEVSHSKSGVGAFDWLGHLSSHLWVSALVARVTKLTVSGCVEKACSASSHKHRRTSGIKQPVSATSAKCGLLGTLQSKEPRKLGTADTNCLEEHGR